MEIGLGYQGQLLEELLDRSVQGETNRDIMLALKDTARRMRTCPLLSLESALEGGGMQSLKEADRAALSPLWLGLGSGDISTQQNLLRAVQTALAAQIDQAKAQATKDQRLALSLGFIGGGVVFLFLL